MLPSVFWLSCCCFLALFLTSLADCFWCVLLLWRVLWQECVPTEVID